MANLSDVTGFIYVEKDFYDKYKSILKDAFDHQGEYGIDVLDWDDRSCSYDDLYEFRFYGCGRWTLEFTLEGMIRCPDENEKKLFDLLKQENVDLKLEYDEYECGMGILQSVSVIIKSDGNLLVDNDEYAYTDRNKVDLCFEDGFLCDYKTDEENLRYEFNQYKYFDHPFVKEHFKNDDDFLITALKFIRTFSELDGGICEYKYADKYEQEELAESILEMAEYDEKHLSSNDREQHVIA